MPSAPSSWKSELPRLSWIVALSLIVSSAWAMDITSCGTTVPAGDVGVLQADLACTGQRVPAAVTLLNKATLQMNSHAIANGDVLCSKSHCTVVGPGEIGGGCVLVERALKISDVSIHDCYFAGIYG